MRSIPPDRSVNDMLDHLLCVSVLSTESKDNVKDKYATNIISNHGLIQARNSVPFQWFLLFHLPVFFSLSLSFAPSYAIDGWLALVIHFERSINSDDKKSTDLGSHVCICPLTFSFT